VRRKVRTLWKMRILYEGENRKRKLNGDRVDKEGRMYREERKVTRN
jgi:hypothetical protein